LETKVKFIEGHHPAYAAAQLLTRDSSRQISFDPTSHVYDGLFFRSKTILAIWGIGENNVNSIVA